jgi:hypothetical protein
MLGTVVASAQSIFINVFGTLAILGIAGACWWAASRIEPHRVARDGSWFTCRSRVIDVYPTRHEQPARASTLGPAGFGGTMRGFSGSGARAQKNATWTEARVFLLDGGHVALKPRSRRAQSFTAPIATASDQHKGRLRYYSLESNPLVEFRIPAKSKVREELDRRVTR